MQIDVTLLHVFDVPVAYSELGLSPVDLLAPMVDAARKELDGLLAEVRTTLPNATARLAQGAPWTEILDAIEQWHIDLVVMGTHGRRGVGRALLGSVTEKVVRLSPVLTVRAEP